MAKKGIYITTKRPLMRYNKNEEKVFNYLLRCTKSATQTQIAQDLKISRPTVIRTLKGMVGKEFRSKNSSYTIICENKRYSMLRKGKTTKGLKDSATYAQKKEFNDKYDTASEKLSTLNALLSPTAENISDNIVRYHRH